MAFCALFPLACLQLVLALNLHSTMVSAFTPPKPRTGQGFLLPLDASVPQHQPASSGAVVNFAPIPISDTQEFAYLVRISIGGQDFMFTFDTASSDLWVASSECTDPDCQAVPMYHKASTLSLTQNPFKLKYVQGLVSGKVGYETVTLGGVEISGQVMGMVTNVSSINLSSVRNSGILGLAFPRACTIRRSAGKTLLENIYEGLDENNRFFAFQLGRGGRPSSFTIGQVDSPRLSNASLSYFPVYPADVYTDAYDYWKLPLHHISINGNPLPFPLSKSRVKGSASPIAVLDTGTSLILGPVKDVNTLWNAVPGATRDTQSGFWMVLCARDISIGFSFGGTDGVNTQEYFVHPRDLSWNGTQNGNLCLAGIQGNDKVISGDWLLGDAFLRNVYATHHAATTTNPPLIGLANLTDPATAAIAFHSERGQDTSSPINFTAKRTFSPTPFLLLSAFAGFAGGLLVALALKLNTCRRTSGRKRLSY